MRVAVFSTKAYDERSLAAANESLPPADRHELHFFESRLDHENAPLAHDFPCVCCFVNDQLDAPTLRAIHDGGTRLIALRCAGFNQVDLAAAADLKMPVVRVPAYSPYAVAEHTVGMMLALNRKLHRAYNRVREGNFSLEGLLGFDLRGKTVGVVGTGKIGARVAKIVAGFECRVLAFDVFKNPDCANAEYVPIERLLAESDIVTLHCPLTPQTRHLINARTLRGMKNGVMLINTSRGALLDTQAVIHGLKKGRIGYLGLDVYEQEAELFFEDLSDQIIQDDVFQRLLTFPNVMITGHQAFFTREAMANIAETTLTNITHIERTGQCANEVRTNK
jgi:D-lactate dehydrogenase